MKLNVGGFSLVELMVGAALLAGIGLAGAKLIKDQRSSQSRFNHDLELDLIHAAVGDTITKTVNNCNATFSHLYNAIHPSPAISDIKYCSGACFYTGSAQALPGIVRYRTGPANAADLSTQHLWYIESFGQLITDDGGPAIGPTLMKLPVNYAHTRFTNRKITKFISLVMRFDAAGRFKQCVVDASSNIQNVEKDICLTLVAYNSLGQLINGRWNGDTNKCEASLVKNCPKGHAPQGVRPDSDVSGPVTQLGCVRTTQSILPSQVGSMTDPMIDTTPVTCVNSGSPFTIYLTPSSGNRIGLRCQ